MKRLLKFFGLVTVKDFESVKADVANLKYENAWRKSAEKERLQEKREKKQRKEEMLEVLEEQKGQLK